MSISKQWMHNLNFLVYTQRVMQFHSALKDKLKNVVGDHLTCWWISEQERELESYREGGREKERGRERERQREEEGGRELQHFIYSSHRNKVNKTGKDSSSLSFLFQ